jgi:hypothetical protein
MFMAALFLGMAAWFRRHRYDGGEPAYWFFAMLIAFSASLAFSAVSWWTGGDTVSRSFWMACWVALSCSAFLVFAFTRSFSSKLDFKLFFWAVPLMFAIALVLAGSDQLLERSGRAWVPRTEQGAYYIYWAISGAYAVLSVYYSVMVYTTLRSHGQREEAGQFRFVLAGILIIIAFQIAAGPLRAALNPGNPISELGTLLGALILMIGIVEPGTKMPGKGKQEVA